MGQLTSAKLEFNLIRQQNREKKITFSGKKTERFEFHPFRQFNHPDIRS
jgi:hypothetical protein